jgi:hypothetical protein
MAKKKVTTPKKHTTKKKAGRAAAEASPDQKPAERPIANALEAFLLEVDAIADTLPLAMPLMMVSAGSAAKELTTFLDSKCRKGDGPTYTVPSDRYLDFLNLKRRFERNKRAIQIIPRSFLASLVSHYDAFLGSLLRAIFYLKPEVLNSSERQFSFKELTSFESISAARESVIDKEVETVLRENHADQFKWMENKFGVPLTRDLPAWPKFIEITERRNLFVHCNGIVSAQYLAVCKQHNVDCSKLKIGQELHAGSKYLQDAYATIVEMGLKLAHVLWRRLKPDELEMADISLNNLCLDLIRDEKYAVAQVLLDFAAQYKNFGSEEIRKILILNRAQAYKWSGQDKRSREILAAEDWRASNEKLQLGASVLNDDFERAARIMKHIGADSSPSKGDYGEWPMFEIFRTSPEFAATYKEVFGRPFGEVTTEEVPVKKDIKSVIQ